VKRAKCTSGIVRAREPENFQRHGDCSTKSVWFKRRPRQTNLTRLATRHNFAIAPTGLGDPFGGKGWRYTCAWCNWSFVVKGRTVVVIDDDGSPMTGKKALVRFNTFAEGPCPALVDEQ
jgi:hypothetical protein